MPNLTKEWLPIRIKGQTEVRIEMEGMEVKTLTFDDNEMQRLRAIIMDKDREEALAFLTEVIWDRIKEKDSKACGPKAV